MGWLLLGVFVVLLLIAAFAALAIPWGPGQPLWMDLRDRFWRRS
jgi:hypothetical protein